MYDNPKIQKYTAGSVKLAYVSFILILASLIFQFIQTVNDDKNLSIWVFVSRISGIIIFLVIVFWTLRVRPKVLGLSDYFIALCLVTLITANAIDLSGYRYTTNSLIAHALINYNTS